MGTRPTADRVKEALFSMIGPYFDGGNVLDLYAGTGALGIEALSRGADHAVFVDADRLSIRTIRHNLLAAGFAEQAEVYRHDARKAIKVLCQRGIVFDYVFLDPPYRMHDMDKLAKDMEDHQLFAPGAVCVIEHDAAFSYPERIGGLHLRRHARYGETALSIYAMKGADAP